MFVYQRVMNFDQRSGKDTTWEKTLQKPSKNPETSTQNLESSEIHAFHQLEKWAYTKRTGHDQTSGQDIDTDFSKN